MQEQDVPKMLWWERARADPWPQRTEVLAASREPGPRTTSSKGLERALLLGVSLNCRLLTAGCWCILTLHLFIILML